jgi:alcohol dehydrogenase class IV
VKEGEIFGFLGPSGAGKTTTIKLLTRQLRPGAGEIAVFGAPIARLDSAAYEQIGILSDNSGVYERMSIYENMKLFADLRGLPASITGQTGMDALTHAVEAFIGRSTTPYTRKMARQAVQLIHDYLLEAYERGDNMRARRNMLSAAYKAGVAFTRSYVGYVHAIAHSLGGRYGIPHGLANAIILPHMLRAYGDAAAPKLADLARMADIAPATAQDGLAAEAFIDWVDRMNVALGIPKYVTGIRRSDIPEMAMHADAEANPLYPVPLLMDRLELERMYEVVAGGMFEGEN